MLGTDLTSEDYADEMKKVTGSKAVWTSRMLPIFVFIDKNKGGRKVSVCYAQILAHVVKGYTLCVDNMSIDGLVSYYRYIDGCIRMIEKSLDIKVDFDPLDGMDDEKKKMVKAAVKIDGLLHNDPYEDIVSEVISYAMNIRENEGDTDKAPIKADISTGTALDDLDALIGLEEVKHQIKSMVNVMQVRKKCEELNVRRPEISLHMVFTGNPGTGKTTVARILGGIYREAGLLSKGHLVEVGRAELVGKYVGHTAAKVKSVFEKAKGGILFIDEAYSLVGEGNDYGHEVVETLIKLMEDNRKDIAVIVAGYPALMQEFLDSNPGLRSRFPFVVEFQDYSGKELTEIFRLFCAENDIQASDSVMKRVGSHFEREASRKDRNYGNARYVRNYFEKMIMNQADRLVKTGRMEHDELCRFIVADIPRANVLRSAQLSQTNLTVVK